jgi:26S proteasome regulatory subunit N7
MKVNEDLDGTKESVNKCHKLLKEGGDWERKNKLKVYEGLYLLQVREFDKAASLLLDCLATFNSAELLSYDELVFLTVTSSLITLDR